MHVLCALPPWQALDPLGMLASDILAEILLNLEMGRSYLPELRLQP